MLIRKFVQIYLVFGMFGKTLIFSWCNMKQINLAVSLYDLAVYRRCAIMSDQVDYIIV